MTSLLRVVQKIKFYQVKKPYASHVCKLNLWLLYYPLPINTFPCILWPTVNIRTAETKQLSFPMNYMKYMHLNQQFFFFFFSGGLRLTVKQILRVLQICSLWLKYTATSHLFKSKGKKNYKCILIDPNSPTSSTTTMRNLFPSQLPLKPL